jgi:acyl-CoA reductase-like NAD-dependent aldehyde dehydrogenase
VADEYRMLIDGEWLPSEGGAVFETGSDLFLEATVIDGVGEEMDIAREETFGPVVPVSVLRSEAEAIDIVNGSPYGLLSAVFTRDLGRDCATRRPSAKDGST